MKNLLLWEEIQVGINKIDSLLKLPDLTNSQRELEYQKRLFLAEIFMAIEYLGTSSEKSKFKYEIWLNRDKDRKAEADRLGFTTMNLRATINYFDSRLKNIIGDDIVKNIVSSSTSKEFEIIKTQFRQNVSKVKKGYFR